MMFCQKFAVAVVLLLAAQTAALVCPHRALEYRDGKVYKDDAGLVNCSNSSTYCMYLSSTTFYPNGTALPSYFEGVHCSDRQHSNDNNETAEFYIPQLAQINFCDIKAMRETHIFNGTVDGSSVQIAHRVNDVRCCYTDNCTMPEYKKIGGGLVQEDSLPKAIYKKVANFYSQLKKKFLW